MFAPDNFWSGLGKCPLGSKLITGMAGGGCNKNVLVCISEKTNSWGVYLCDLFLFYVILYEILMIYMQFLYLVGTFQIKDEEVLVDTLRTSLKAGYTLIGDGITHFLQSSNLL